MKASEKPTISIIIPALNEEANIADAVAGAKRAVEGRFSDYELLLFNDGSTDRTGAIMDELAKTDPRIVVTHNTASRNLGGVYKQGVALARHEYLIMVPGDNENPDGALDAPFAALGDADIVVPFVGRSTRTLTRTVVSKAYVALMNRTFGLRVRYYNGTVIHRTRNVREVSITTDSFAYQSELLVKLIRKGKSFVEIPIEVKPSTSRSSKAFRPRNVYGVLASVARLAYEVHVTKGL